MELQVNTTPWLQRSTMPAAPSTMDQLCREQLDVTTEIGLQTTQDLSLKHSPTFFGSLPFFGSSKHHKDDLNSCGDNAQRFSHERFSTTPPMSPRVQRIDVSPQQQSGVAVSMPDDRMQVRSQWKTEDIARLQHELEQLRCAAQALPNTDIEPASSASSPRCKPEPPRPNPPVGQDELPSLIPWPSADALHSGVLAYGSGSRSGQNSPRAAPQFSNTAPLRIGSSEGQSTAAVVQSGSPKQPLEPEVTATSSLVHGELREAQREVERLRRALHKAHQEIATLREEKKATEAAHSRDVAALATLLQQVTAEKAQLAENAKNGKIDKSMSSMATDDTWSVSESELDSIHSERVTSFSDLLTAVHK